MRQEKASPASRGVAKPWYCMEFLDRTTQIRRQRPTVLLLVGWQQLRGNDMTAYWGLALGAVCIRTLFERVRGRQAKSRDSCRTLVSCIARTVSS